MLNKITFLGTESVGVIYANPGHASRIEYALSVRGYRTTKGSEVNPWLDGSGHTQMTAVTGHLIKADVDMLLFLAADEEALDAAWSAIRLSFPEAVSAPETLTRPA